MAVITYAGKGSQLEKYEVDANWINLDKRLVQGAVDPTATNDSGQGFKAGESVWINKTDDAFWKCADDTVGGAVWEKMEEGRGNDFFYKDNFVNEIRFEGTLLPANSPLVLHAFVDYTKTYLIEYQLFESVAGKIELAGEIYTVYSTDNTTNGWDQFNGNSMIYTQSDGLAEVAFPSAGDDTLKILSPTNTVQYKVKISEVI